MPYVGSSEPNRDFASRGPLPPHSIVYGLREWFIRSDGVLTGCVYKKAWTTGTNRAVCLLYATSGFVNPQAAALSPRLDGYNTFPDHDMENCHHGFYAYYDGSQNYHEEFKTVGGVIKGWGKAVVGTRGFRVEYAEIMGLVFGEEPTRAQRERVRRRYSNIPMFRTQADLLEAYPLTAGDLEYVPDPEDPFWSTP